MLYISVYFYQINNIHFNFILKIPKMVESTQIKEKADQRNVTTYFIRRKIENLCV